MLFLASSLPPVTLYVTLNINMFSLVNQVLFSTTSVSEGVVTNSIAVIATVGPKVPVVAPVVKPVVCGNVIALPHLSLKLLFTNQL